MISTSPHLHVLEDVLRELLLQLLVGVIDAELLEAVVLKGLEPEDVQQVDGALVTSGRASHRVVDLRHQPVEHPARVRACVRRSARRNAVATHDGKEGLN